MAKKPIMTKDDYDKRELEKFSKMSEEEQKEYLRTLEKAYNEGVMSGMKVAFEDEFESDDDIPYVTLDNVGTIMNTLNKEFVLKTRLKDGKKSKYHSKVYITAHHDDFNQLFDNVSKKFLESYKCDIYYYDNFGENCNTKTYSQLLSQMALMVVLVTEKFLSESSRALDLDIKIAKEYDIPVLPIYIDGPVDVFNKKVGNTELLNYYGLDFTEKLESYLNGKLINDKLFNRIEKEFSKHLFLSYRKKDIKDALKVLDYLKGIDGLWDTSIWYDDYLTPGEKYDEEIDENIKKCDLFVLLCTPNLLEKENYVVSIEYPKAKEYAKEILPIETEETSEELYEVYKDLPSKIVFSEKLLIAAKLINSLKVFNKVENSTAEHLYYIGLAYYYGIGVNKDIEYSYYLLREASKKKHILSIYFLAQKRAHLHMDNKAEIISLYEYVENEIGKELDQENYSNIDMWWTVSEVLTAEYSKIRDFDKDKDLLLKMMKYSDKLSKRKADVITAKARVCFRMSIAYELTKDYDNLFKYGEMAKEYIDEVMSMDISDKPISLYFSIAYIELRLAVIKKDYIAYCKVFEDVNNFYQSVVCNFDLKVFNVDFEYAQFIQSYSTNLFNFKGPNIRKKAYEESLKAIDLLNDAEENTLTNSVLSGIYNTLSSNYFYDKKIDQAIEYGFLAIDYAKKGNIDNSDMELEMIAKSLFNYANINFQTDHYEEAQKAFLESIDFCSKNDFRTKYYILQMSTDYYAQLLVQLKEYDEAFNYYANFVGMVINSKLEGDEIYSYCANFSYRAGYVALYFLDDNKKALWGMKNALIFIEHLNKPSQDMLDLKQRIMDMFE